MTVVLVGIWLAGFVVALRAAATRWMLVALAATMAPYWWWITGGDQNYVANRVVAMSVPTAMVLICIGVSEVGPIEHNAPARRLGLAVVSVAGVLGLVGSAMVTHQTVSLIEPTRRVGSDDIAAVKWIRNHGGESGNDVVVVNPNIHSQLFVMDRTNDLRDVAWLQLHPAYTRRLLFAPVRPVQYALAHRDATFVGATEVLERNGTWDLVDIRGGAVVLAPDRGGRSSTADGFERWSAGSPMDVQVAVGSACTTVSVEVRAVSGRPQTFIAVGASADGPLTAESVDSIGSGDTSRFDLPVSEGGFAFVRFGGDSQSGTAAALEGRTLDEVRGSSAASGFSGEVRFVLGTRC